MNLIMLYWIKTTIQSIYTVNLYFNLAFNIMSSKKTKDPISNMIMSKYVK